MFSAYKNRITPRTSQSAGFDIGASIITTRYPHNVKKSAAPTAPGNSLHSTEHTKWLIWYNETTARVVCTNVLYFPNNPHTSKTGASHLLLHETVALVVSSPRSLTALHTYSPESSAYVYKMSRDTNPMSYRVRNRCPVGRILPLRYHSTLNLGSVFGSTRHSKWTGSPSPTPTDSIYKYHRH